MLVGIRASLFGTTATASSILCAMIHLLLGCITDRAIIRWLLGRITNWGTLLHRPHRAHDDWNRVIKVPTLPCDKDTYLLRGTTPYLDTLAPYTMGESHLDTRVPYIRWEAPLGPLLVTMCIYPMMMINLTALIVLRTLRPMM